MNLPLLSAIFAAFALTLYVMLDGFDLGVGALLLFATDEPVRDRMVDAIMPIWDGNETWLVMAGVTLLAGFPIAYGILLPAFYVPLVLMLLALGLRGVSFEFRWHARHRRWLWDAAFGVGSIVAALMQGTIVGGLIHGLVVHGSSFAGSVFDVFRPPCSLTALAVLAGYMTLGAGWLHLKGRTRVRTLAERSLRLSAPLFVLLAVASIALALRLQPRTLDAWHMYPRALTGISAGFLAAAALLVRAVGRKVDSAPFLLGLVTFAFGISGLALVIYPDVVPFSLTLWDAASPTHSQVFVLVGAAVVTPIVLGYTALSYYVFRGKTPAEGWED